MSAEPGSYRFVWDLRYALPPATRRGYPISAIAHNTIKSPRGVLVLPGTYTVKLTAGGATSTQPLVVRMDPRVKTAPLGLRQQFDLSMRVVDAWRRDSLALAEVRAMRGRLDSLEKAVGQGTRAESIVAIDAKLAALAGVGGGRFGGGRGAASQAPTLNGLNGQLGGLYGLLQGTDAAPTLQATAAVARAVSDLGPLLARWDGLRREAAAALR